jgi:uncharacterized membrane protein
MNGFNSLLENRMRKTIRMSIVLIIVSLILMFLRRRNNGIEIETNEPPELKVVQNSEDEIIEDEMNEKDME